MEKSRHLLLALLLSLALALTGCGNLGSGPSPESVTKSFLTALQKADWETVSVHSLDGKRLQPKAGEEAMMKAYLSRMSFKVLDSTVKGVDAEVTVELTLPAIERVIGELVGSAIKTALSSAFNAAFGDKSVDVEKELEEKFVAVMADPALPLVTTQGTVTLRQEGGKWKVDQIRGISLGKSLLQ